MFSIMFAKIAKKIKTLFFPFLKKIIYFCKQIIIKEIHIDKK